MLAITVAPTKTRQHAVRGVDTLAGKEPTAKRPRHVVTQESAQGGQEEPDKAWRRRLRVAVADGGCDAAGEDLRIPLSTTAEEDTYLQCPYREKDLVKELGALFDAERKAWYVPEGDDLRQFRRWLPAGGAQRQQQWCGYVSRRPEAHRVRVLSWNIAEMLPSQVGVCL
jgi:hypothetical protein